MSSDKADRGALSTIGFQNEVLSRQKAMVAALCLLDGRVGLLAPFTCSYVSRKRVTANGNF